MSSVEYGASSTIRSDCRDCSGDVGEPIYIAEAIAYTNGDPHVGHAYEIIAIDVVASYHKVFGRDCLFSSGTDEHGQKIAETARNLNKEPIEICDYYSGKFRELQSQLSCNPDIFVRTTADSHKAAARKCWEACVANDDIYLDKYEGWYDVRNETFVPEAAAQAADFKDPETGVPYKKTVEECYFFRLSKYQDFLIEWITNNPRVCRPESHRNSILSFIKSGLEDICVSRTTFSWGVPVPDAPSHVMYVWFDALTNYITNLGYQTNDALFEKHWQNPESTKKNVIIVGKDIIRFHCIIWPAILKSAGLALPNSVHAHGFVGAADGKKMSKSLGNVICPQKLLEQYDSDSLRYYIASGCVYGQDMKFDEDCLLETHNGTLADVLGNLINRATALTKKFCDSKVPEVDISMYTDSKDVPFSIKDLRDTCDEIMDELHLHEYCSVVASAARATNKYLADKAPWLMKNQPEEQRRIVYITLQACYILVKFFAPLCPKAMNKTIEGVFNGRDTSLAKLATNYDELPVGLEIGQCGVLFPKIVVGATPEAKPKRTGYEEAKRLKEEKKALMKAKQEAQRNNKTVDK